MAHTIPLTPADITRRRFLAAGVFGLGGAIGLVYLVAILRYLVPETPSGNTGFDKVGPASGFTKEVPKLVPLGLDAQGKNPSGGGWVIQHSDTQYTVFDMHCTHLSCPYAWTNEGKPEGVFACPCHGSVFAKDGSVINGPAFIPLKQRAWKVDNGQVLVGGLQ